MEEQTPQPAAPHKKETTAALIRSLAILIALVFAFKHSILDANNIPTGSMIPTLKIGDYLFVNKMRYSVRFPFTQVELAHIDDPGRGDIITFIPPGSTEKNYVKRVMGMPGDRIRIRNIPVCKLGEYTGVSKENIAKREYECGKASAGYAEPVVAFVEYKEKDAGPWMNYKPRELSGDVARSVLKDADNANVLHPDAFPQGRETNFLPVVLEETSGNIQHYVVEKAQAAPPTALCSEIETTGCVVPAHSYLAMGDNRDDSLDSRFLGFIRRDAILGKAVVIYFSIDWKDDVCRSFFGLFGDMSGPEAGFRLEDFPPEKQQRFCSRTDTMSEYEGIGGYLKRTAMYRLPRLSVRWKRVGNLLK